MINFASKRATFLTEVLVILLCLELFLRFKEYRNFHYAIPKYTEPGYYYKDKNNISDVAQDTRYFNKTLTDYGVIFHPKGGIGNQLFVYACLHALARDLRRPLYVAVSSTNLSLLNRDFIPAKREFVLDKFQVPMDNLIYQSTVIPPTRYEVTDTELLFRNYPHKRFYSLEYESYCQSESFWAPYKEEILNMFQLKPEVVQEFSPYVSQLADEIRNENDSVCVHVRRGDFIRKRNILPISFQRWAIQNITEMLQMGHPKEESTPMPKFFVFSDDDIDYVRNELVDLGKSHNFVFVSSVSSSGRRTTSLEDLYLMTKCKHFVIPNSSFGWWAAYLSKGKRELGRITTSKGIVIVSEFKPNYWENLERKNKEKLPFYKLLHAQGYCPKDWIIYYPDGAIKWIHSP